MAWETYTITNKSVDQYRITFKVDRDLPYKVFEEFDYRTRNTFQEGDILKKISFKIDYPFLDWQEGDILEMNMEMIRNWDPFTQFIDTSIVRKIGTSNAVVSRSSSTNIISTRGSSSDIVIPPSAVDYMKSQEARELAREMSRMVDDNPGKEVEYKIQVENKDGRKISHSLIMRKQN